MNFFSHFQKKKGELFDDDVDCWISNIILKCEIIENSRKVERKLFA